MKITDIQLTHDLLPEEFTKLETALLYWQHLDAGIWPIKEWDEDALKSYIRRLYRLVHECLAMQQHRNAPEIIPYCSDEEDWFSQVQLIYLTRQLIFCCDRDTISGYRRLSAEEEALIATLLQIHAVLIGMVYLERAGQERLAAVSFR
jgi:hypothetical protein